MPVTSASAPGKTILVGEHAVVYGQPAIAVPVNSVRAKAVLQANPFGETGVVTISAPDIDLQARLDELPDDNPIRFAVQSVLDYYHLERLPCLTMRVTSSIPVASGMGSSAATAIAILRGVSVFIGHPLPLDSINKLAYEIEKLHHGSPSGIDNTVIAYNRPVYFRRDAPLEILTIKTPLKLIIAESGEPSSTREMVAGVRQRWEEDKSLYQGRFEQIGAIAVQARQALQSGQVGSLGGLLTENHRLLAEIGVSTPRLDRLVAAALAAGAAGAKLTGGGGGGNMIALADADRIEPVAAALTAAGALRTLVSDITSYPIED